MYLPDILTQFPVLFIPAYWYLWKQVKSKLIILVYMLTQQCSLAKFCGYTVHTKDYSIFFFYFCSSFILRSLYKCYAFNRSRISSVGRALDYRAGGHGFDSRDRTNTQGLKNDWEMKVLPLSRKCLDLHVARMTK